MSGEVFSLVGTWIQRVARTLLRLAHPSAYYPQLLIHMSTNDTVLSVKQHLGYVELLYGLGNGLGESLYIRIRREANEGDTLVGTCYKQPHQDKEADEVF